MKTMNAHQNKTHLRSGDSVLVSRYSLGALGAGMIGYGVLGLPTQLTPSQLLGLLIWLAMAILIHDGLIVPLTTLTGHGIQRFGGRLRPASTAVIRGTMLTGAVVTLIAVLLLKAQSVGRNPTALEADYATHLLGFWGGLLVHSAVLIYTVESRSTRGVRV